MQAPALERQTNPAMTEQILTDYRMALMELYGEQIAGFSTHPALNDSQGLHRPLKPGEWSPHRVLFHLRAAEAEAYAPRLRWILEHDQPELPDFDEGAWMAEHYDPQEPVQAILQTWQQIRRESARRLDGIPAKAWSRTGRHIYWGERTLQWWVERSLAHADEHRDQLDGK